eukprot:CFRG0316T1
MSTPKKQKVKFEKPTGPPPTTVTEVFKHRIDTMMKQVDKPMHIPARPKEKGPPKPKEFFRNVMGSTAGAGSGEFHVFRATRRHEYAREAYHESKSQHDNAEKEFHEKRMREEEALEAAAAKKRAKRLKKKKNKKERNVEETEEVKKMTQRPADLDEETDKPTQT